MRSDPVPGTRDAVVCQPHILLSAIVAPGMSAYAVPPPLFQMPALPTAVYQCKACLRHSLRSLPEDVVRWLQVLHDDEGHVSIVQVQLGHMLGAVRILLRHGLGFVSCTLLHAANLKIPCFTSSGTICMQHDLCPLLRVSQHALHHKPVNKLLEVHAQLLHAAMSRLQWLAASCPNSSPPNLLPHSLVTREAAGLARRRLALVVMPWSKHFWELPSGLEDSQQAR